MARVGEAEAALVRRDHQTAGTRSVSGMTGCIKGFMMSSWCTLPTMMRATGTGSLGIPTAM
jgi:hypothetical protein